MRLYKALATSSGIAGIIVVAPFLSTFIAAAIADSYGCGLNEGAVSPCMVAGKDIGRMLYNMGMAFWLFIFSFLYVPVAIGLAVAAVVVWIRDQSGKHRARRVGLIFWLLLFAALLFPLTTNFSLLLIACAGGLHFWRRRGFTYNDQ